MAPKSPKSRISAKPHKATWDKAEPDQRRDLIIDVAYDILTTKGIDHVTIRRVASQIGVGAMTLYTYIDGQQGLRTALIDRGFEKMGENCDKEAKHTGDWIAGCSAYLDFAVSHPNLYNLMFAHPLDEQDLAQIQSHFDEWEKEIYDDYAARGVPEEQIKDIVENTSRNLWIAMHGFASLLIAKRIPWNAEENNQILQAIVTKLCPEVPALNKTLD
ncbi:TetR/AcrR family transcriptional regulator [Poriferisphaera sp. WC338]|uniref:TetR/AcrR family transcriptional regulator n=1 Tax=Poriferisphaera sp. WC338 TaxID=3425129 RepID=UPI003D814B1A